MGIIRLLLALSVVAAHCGLILNLDFVGGRIAVQAFYIISGFYMSLILNEKYIGVNGNYKLFISNRFLRLYPIYWTVLILSIIISVYIKFNSTNNSPGIINFYSEYFENIKAMIFLFFSQILIFGQDIIMFFGLNHNTIFFTKNYALITPEIHRFLFIPQAWTLGIEITFYLIAPFILRKNWKFILLILLLSVSLKLYLYFGLNLTFDPWNYRFFPSELMFFLIGYFCYLMSLKLKKHIIPEWFNISLFISLVIFTLFYFKIPSFGYPLFLIELGYFILFISSLPFLFIYFKNKKWDTFIGDLSYPIYVSHLFIATLYAVCGFQFSGQGIYVAIWCIIFSILVNILIAHPIERLRQSRIKN